MLQGNTCGKHSCDALECNGNSKQSEDKCQRQFEMTLNGLTWVGAYIARGMTIKTKAQCTRQNSGDWNVNVVNIYIYLHIYVYLQRVCHIWFPLQLCLMLTVTVQLCCIF